MKETTLLFFAVFLSGTAYAQSNNLTLLFESEPGMRPASYEVDHPIFSVEEAKRFDANGDGRPDLVLQREDAQGNLQDLRVLDGRTRALLWEVQDVQTTLGFNFDPELWGFADPLGTGTPYAIFHSDHEVKGSALEDNGDEFQLRLQGPSSLRLIAAIDLTSDGWEELIIFLPDTEQIQVWGKP